MDCTQIMVPQCSTQNHPQVPYQGNPPELQPFSSKIRGEFDVIQFPATGISGQDKTLSLNSKILSIQYRFKDQSILSAPKSLLTSNGKVCHKFKALLLLRTCTSAHVHKVRLKYLAKVSICLIASLQ
jgi:hypothetical protein